MAFIWIWAAMISNGFWEAYVERKHAWDDGKLEWKIRIKKHVWLTAYLFWLFLVMSSLLITLLLIIFGFDVRLLGLLLSVFLAV